MKSPKRVKGASVAAKKPAKSAEAAKPKVKKPAEWEVYLGQLDVSLGKLIARLSGVESRLGHVDEKAHKIVAEIRALQLGFMCKAACPTQPYKPPVPYLFPTQPYVPAPQEAYRTWLNQTLAAKLAQQGGK